MTAGAVAPVAVAALRLGFVFSRLCNVCAVIGFSGRTASHGEHCETPSCEGGC